ncbi:MAG: TonB family protein [Acidobacteria bacterium]|nr:TonB family protein [Acidobacteriota bacterium]
MSKTHLRMFLFPVAALLLAAGPTPARQEQDGRIYRIGGGVKAPQLVSKVEPKYTEEARDAKLQGAVKLKLVVNAKGRPENVEVVESLDAGLDRNAIEAVRQWVFEPGTKDGKPVRVLASVELNFRLK